MSEEGQDQTGTTDEDAVLTPEDTEWLTETEEGQETISAIIDELTAE